MIILKASKQETLWWNACVDIIMKATAWLHSKSFMRTSRKSIQRLWKVWKIVWMCLFEIWFLLYLSFMLPQVLLFFFKFIYYYFYSPLLFQNSKIKFPLPHRIIKSHYKSKFVAKRPNTFYWKPVENDENPVETMKSDTGKLQ